ncbi:uncharacterized protein LOC119643771 isoform X2 [Glossina fuscipes]|nr:uncharacterized protein LOC119643771 isoform X2 [Glossina fuscipes]
MCIAFVCRIILLLFFSSLSLPMLSTYELKSDGAYPLEPWLMTSNRSSEDPLKKYTSKSIARRVTLRKVQWYVQR